MPKTANIQSVEIYEISYIQEIKKILPRLSSFDVHLVKNLRVCFLWQLQGWKKFYGICGCLVIFYDSCGFLAESFDSLSYSFMETMEWYVS